jgi:hypothetical protein
VKVCNSIQAKARCNSRTTVDSCRGSQSPTISDSSNEPSPSRETSLAPAPVRRDQKSHSRKKPADHIPRPRNAFIIFRSDFVAQNRVPSSVERNHQNISKIAGAVWKAMPSEEKAIWYRRADEEKDEHARQYPGYQYNPAGLAELFSTGKRRRKVQKGRGVEDLQACELKCKYVADLVAGGRSGIALEEAVKDRDFTHEATEISWADSPIATSLADSGPKNIRQTGEGVMQSSSVVTTVLRKGKLRCDQGFEPFMPPDPALHHPNKAPLSQENSLPKPRAENPMSISSLLHPTADYNTSNAPSVGNVLGRCSFVANRIEQTSTKISSPEIYDESDVSSVESYVGLPLSNARDKAIPYETTRTSDKSGSRAIRDAWSSVSSASPAPTHSQYATFVYDDDASSSNEDFFYAAGDAVTQGASPNPRHGPQLSRHSYSSSHTRSQHGLRSSSKHSSTEKHGIRNNSKDSFHLGFENRVKYNRSDHRRHSTRTATCTRSPSPIFSLLENTHPSAAKGAAYSRKRMRSPSPYLSERHSPRSSEANLSDSHDREQQPFPFKVRRKLNDS